MRAWRSHAAPPPQRRSTGLGMVEVLAAMVIFSTGAVLLFGWMADASNRLARLRAEQRQLFVQLSALEFSKTLNPMQQPSGQARLADGVLLSWKSRPLGGIDAAGWRGGLYEVGLYEVDLEAEAAWGVVPAQRLRLAGWRQTRDASDGMLFAPGARP